MKINVWMVCVVMFMISNEKWIVITSAYKNYTVGDDLGWFDKLEKSTVNYQKWASSKTFSLGDFLIFNTDNNHTVVQTYNSTIYNLCDDSDSLDNDTFHYASPDPSAAIVHPVSVAVPLLKVGPTYFFSSDYDGEQCENGQKFSINVTQGQGLPPDLRPPSPEAPGPVSQQSGDDTVPDTLVPANFDHPKDLGDADSDDDDDDGKKKKSNGVIIQNSRWGFLKISILFGVLHTCW
uniref:cucumber peeling cupredoxin n=1 Tax=Erigeron canadensis TaxID=72917 RepID=UPI001CB9D729|nr:cucumber peeling cupredoxin [Erigeron canadensis]